MSPKDIYQKFASSVGHLVFHNESVRLSSGTGFLINDLLVTCAHVTDKSPTTPLQVKFPNPDSGQALTWDVPGGIKSLEMVGHSNENGYDYAILKPPSGVNLVKSLVFSLDEPDVGEEVCGLGYPFDHEDLTLSTGHISAIVDSGVAKLLKLDMSVNPSNSGGPLIRIDDGSVVGIISRKATGLSRQFDDLMVSFDNNIRALSPTIGTMVVGSVDIMHAITASQTQMKRVAIELERSAQVGIGWAVYVDPLRSETAFNT